MSEQKPDKRKQSLYFPSDTLEEIAVEAQRLDRSLSWTVQRAWQLAKSQIKAMPSLNEPEVGTGGGKGGE